MDKKKVSIIVTAISVVVLAILFLTLTPSGKKLATSWRNALFEASEDSYANKKIVEDTCRSMIANYTSDVLMYEQYREGDEEERSWASKAKLRANKTAASYNEYVIKNKHIWKDNIPEDIKIELDYVE